MVLRSVRPKVPPEPVEGPVEGRRANFPVLPALPGEESEGRPFARLLHVDDELRLERWLDWLSNDTPPAPASLDSEEVRLALMLFAALGHVGSPVHELQEKLRQLWAHEPLRDELRQLFRILRDRLRRRTIPLKAVAGTPLQVHATYSLDQIAAGLGDVRNGKIFRPREGVLYLPKLKCDVFFVTLEKSEKHDSPTTLYRDYPISARSFHWESQSGTTESSPTGQRYIRHASQGGTVLLFVRERRHDERGETMPYLFLGPATYERHEVKPMQIAWELEEPMPADFYQVVKLAAG